MDTGCRLEKSSKKWQRVTDSEEEREVNISLIRLHLDDYDDDYTPSDFSYLFTVDWLGGWLVGWFGLMAYQPLSVI